MQFAAAWTAMAVAFGVHVIDEATTDFLASYNPVARQIRARLRLPFPPVFTFWPWFLGLLTVTAILFGLIPQATAQKAWMAWLALVFAIINIGNGLLHIGASMRFAHVTSHKAMRNRNGNGGQDQAGQPPSAQDEQPPF